MRQAAAVERHGALRHQLDRLAEILEGRVVLAECHMRVAPVVVGGAIAGGEGDGAVEILDRLVGVAEIHQRIAAIVIDDGVLGRELDRFVEILDRVLGLVHAPFGHAAIAVDARLDEVGDLRRGERLVVGGDRFVVLPAHEGRRAFARAQQGLVLGMRRDAGRDNEKDREQPTNGMSRSVHGHDAAGLPSKPLFPMSPIRREYVNKGSRSAWWSAYFAHFPRRAKPLGTPDYWRLAALSDVFSARSTRGSVSGRSSAIRPGPKLWPRRHAARPRRLPPESPACLAPAAREPCRPARRRFRRWPAKGCWLH